ncbi:DUF6221 family protein [Micromonospora tulbaghiae]|uniref:DUF6221 family protein n=1 Tax=Micromonospora tulbaghiae TaxID=479978 RepID=UPI0033D2F964
MDDLTGFLNRQIENQRHRANALKALAVALPAKAAAYVAETADLLHADADAKREIIVKYERAMEQEPKRPDDQVNRGYILGMNAAAVALTRAYADRPGFRPEWRP